MFLGEFSDLGGRVSLSENQLEPECQREADSGEGEGLNLPGGEGVAGSVFSASHSVFLEQ